ncbi:MAG: BPL-N domain-containing protein [Chlamydiales bacterium]
MSKDIPRDIVIYVDQGVSGDALRQTVKCLQKEVDLNAHKLKRKDAAQILGSAWEKETQLLIMPGGRDIYYHASLQQKGADRLKRFIENGGGYLGICAGAYFAADAIEFEKGGRLQVCGERHLKLFPGRAIGPAYGHGKYSYESDEGVEAAHISWRDQECFAYFNGGCYFDSAHTFSDVRVFGRYLNIEDAPAAIVECKVGKGRAFLSGVHIEFCAPLLSRGSRHIERIYPQLEKGESARREIFREILKEFNIKLK